MISVFSTRGRPTIFLQLLICPVLLRLCIFLIHSCTFKSSLSKCMHLLLFGMSWIYMFKTVVAWAEKMEHVWLSLHMYFLCLVARFISFYVKAQWCVACPGCMSERLNPHATYRTSDERHQNVMRCCANILHTIFHLLSDHNEFGYSKYSWMRFLYVFPVIQLLSSRKCDIVPITVMLKNVSMNYRKAVNGKIWSTICPFMIVSWH